MSAGCRDKNNKNNGGIQSIVPTRKATSWRCHFQEKGHDGSKGMGFLAGRLGREMGGQQGQMSSCERGARD